MSVENSPPIGAKPIDQTQNVANKKWVHQQMQAIVAAGRAGVQEILANTYHADAHWRGAHPLNEMSGIAAMAQQAWQPLFEAMPDIERRDEIVVGGRFTDRHSETRDMVAMVGHYIGTFKNDWLDIPATGQPMFLRYGEVHELRDGKIERSSCIWDILDFIRQAGFWPLAPSWGTEGLWLGPFTGDGLVFDTQDMDEGLASIAQTLAMHQTLGEYNDHELAGREGLLNMPQKEHWHDKMMWYGPSGIGTTRGLAGFVDFHQLPFRLAWPGRKGGANLFKDENPRFGHYIQIGDGAYSVTGGWPSVVAYHSGGGLFGTGPTNRQVEMRVMDFYLHHEGKIRENWVPIDILHLLLQMDIDVMQRMRDQFGRNRLGLRA